MKIQILILGFKGLMKGAVDHLCLVHFVNNASYESLFAVELEKKITCEWQNLSFVSNKYVSQALNQTWRTKKLLDLIFLAAV